GATGTALSGDWLVVTPDAAVGPELVTAVTEGLAHHGATVHPVTAAQLADADRLPADVAGVVSLAALDDRPAPDQPAVTRGFADTVTTVRALSTAAPDTPLWLL